MTAEDAPPVQVDTTVVKTVNPHGQSNVEAAAMPALLDGLEVTPVQSERHLITPHGRSVEVVDTGDNGGERVSIRAPHGKLLLQIRFTDAGAVVELEQAELELTATKRLSLRSDEVVIDAGSKLSLRSGAQMRTEVQGNASSHVAGQERREAADLQLQSTAGGIDMRARDAIQLDGHHVGLNDRTTREMFEWTELDPEGEATRTHSEGDE